MTAYALIQWLTLLLALAGSGLLVAVMVMARRTGRIRTRFGIADRQGRPKVFLALLVVYAAGLAILLGLAALSVIWLVTAVDGGADAGSLSPGAIDSSRLGWALAGAVAGLAVTALVFRRRMAAPDKSDDAGRKA